MRQITAAALQIAEKFRPQRIYLFGSHAWGSRSEHSDVDFLILMNGNGRRVHDWAVRISLAINFGFPVDMVVRSPQEFERRIKWGDGFLIDVRDKGKVIYEAADARVDHFKSNSRISAAPDAERVNPA